VRPTSVPQIDSDDIFTCKSKMFPYIQDFLDQINQ